LAPVGGQIATLVSADLKLNPHLPVVLPDGAYAVGMDGNLEFPSAAAAVNERRR
jgi:hypothetical protein